MKNKFIITALCSLFTFCLFAQERLTKEESAIKTVIENETEYFMQRDFDKWASCVAHDPMTYYNWTSPFVSDNSIMEKHGWKEVSKATKAYMKNNPPKENKIKKTNYQFKVNGNMAFVTFMENGEYSGSRTMEKKNGEWKILRMSAIASEDFRKKHQLYKLQHLAGNWEADMSTYKKGVGGSYTLIGGQMNIERTATGIIAREHYTYENEDGEIRPTEELVLYSLDMKTGKIGSLSSSYKAHSSWTTAYSSVGEFDEDGTLVFTSHRVGEEDSTDVAKWSFKKDGDKIKWSLTVKDETGKVIYSRSCDYKRAGSSDIIVAKP